MRLSKIASLLLSVSFVNAVYAQNSIFTITPLNSKGGAVTVGAGSLSPFKLIWSVRNNTNRRVQPNFSLRDSDGIGDLVFAPPDARTEGSDCAEIAPGGTCTFSIGIIGRKLLPGRIYKIIPQVCIGDGQACSIPDMGSRVTVQATTNPEPSGTWTSLGTVDRTVVPEYLSINYPKFAVGVINSNFMPTVVECPDVDSVYGCRLLGNGLIDQNFSTMTGLDYTSDGNLIGLFLKFPMDAGTPNTTYVMQYPASSSSWSSFGSSFSGSAEGLDTASSTGVLVSSSLNAVGVAKQYSSNADSSLSQENSSSTSLSGIVDDGLGNIFVAGAGNAPQTAGLWLWSPTNGQFTAVNLGDQVVTLVTDMVSDGAGTIYLSGLDVHSQGQVWKYSKASGVFQNTGISASYVSTLEWSPYGYLLAGVVRSDNYNGDVYFYSSNAWASLELTDCANVDAIAADANNDILVAGLTSMGYSGIWKYN